MLLGAFGVGKSSLVKRYLHSTFDERYHATLGARIEKQRVSVAGHDTTLMIWDFAGEDEIVDFPAFVVIDDKGNDFFGPLLNPAKKPLPVA